MRAYAATLTSLHARLLKMRRIGITAVRALQLQDDVLRAVCRSERRIRQLRGLIASDRAQLASAPGARLSKADARVVKNRIKRHLDGIDRLRRILFLTRSITDGLAFAVMPKWDIKPLNSKEASGFVSGKAGLRLERRIQRALVGRGHLVILNDLTNCIRYGDLTVARHPIPFVIEVKSSGVDSSRVRRQLAKGQEVAEYLRNDVSPNWQGSGWTVVRRSLLVAERSHRRRLVPMIEAARRVGHAISWPEPGLCYCCIGRSSVRSVIERLRPRFKQPPMAYPVFPADSLPAYYYPLTLSIADSNAWWSVVTGESPVLVLIDPERIQALGRSMRLVIAQLDEPDWLWSVTAESDDASLGPIKISHQFFGRVACEFLSLQWFVEESAARVFAGPAARGLEAGTDSRPNLGSPPRWAGGILGNRG